MLTYLAWFFFMGLGVLVLYGLYKFVESFVELVQGEPEYMNLVIIFIAVAAMSFPLAVCMYIHYRTKRVAK